MHTYEQDMALKEKRFINLRKLTYFLKIYERIMGT